MATFLFLGALGVLTNAAAILTSQDTFAIMAGTVGFVVWGVWSFGALNVREVTRCCVQQYSFPPLAIIGLMFALVPAYIALTGPLELAARARTVTSGEEL